jgi:hypothetical protein
LMETGGLNWFVGMHFFPSSEARELFHMSSSLCVRLGSSTRRRFFQIFWVIQLSMT